MLDGDALGFIEVESCDDNPRTRGTAGLWDVGNLHVDVAHRGQGVGTWLLAHAAEWVRLGEGTRLLAYASDEEVQLAQFLQRSGFRLLTRTARGWTLKRGQQRGAVGLAVAREECFAGCGLLVAGFAGSMVGTMRGSASVDPVCSVVPVSL